MNAWELVKQTLAASLSAESFENWVVRTTLARTDGDTIFVAVPNEATREWMEREYSIQVREAISHLSLPYSTVVYSLETAPERLAIASAANGYARPGNMTHAYTDSPQSIENLFSQPVAHLNPKFTFDKFVVGSCNQFAHAAAHAVAMRPSRSYNPLFIYGGVGMGKTHLMHAIGRNLLTEHPGMKIVYTTSEKFMNQMIQCIRMEKMPYFHQFYRSADVLLIDDIQIIGGKERTQEEFFHTFNSLMDGKKQIILTCDRFPKDLDRLDDRLKSRFSWGLTVSVEPPDLETRVAILLSKAEQFGMSLTNEVAFFVAQHVRSNVRELEGVLLRLSAGMRLQGEAITVEFARATLRDMLAHYERKVTIDNIMSTVAKYYNIPVKDLRSPRRSRMLARPRQVAMALARELTEHSLPDIGEAFEKDHTTVLHADRKVKELRQTDLRIREDYENLLRQLSY